MLLPIISLALILVLIYAFVGILTSNDRLESLNQTIEDSRHWISTTGNDETQLSILNQAKTAYEEAVKAHANRRFLRMGLSINRSERLVRELRRQFLARL